MATKLPIAELEFLQTVGNHRDFRNRLLKLGLAAADGQVEQFARQVGSRWLMLAQHHLRDAKRSLKSKSRRAVYSRSYYAAYNASKSVRYIATGFVSLKADDHQKASELPGDFPDPVNWGAKITKLYEQRLRSDYDNWEGMRGRFTMRTDECVKTAGQFFRICKKYLRDKHGLTI